MSEIHKTKVLILIIVVVAIALLFPVFFGAVPSTTIRVGENNWRTFIYDFQTLITGVLAIAAAFLTIKASQKIDERQQIRHEQLYYLQIRPNRLRVERMLIPSLEELLVLRATIADTSFDGAGKNVEDVVDELQVYFSKMKTTYTAVSDIVDGTRFENTSDLFEGHLTHNFDTFVKKLETAFVRSYSGESSCIGLKTAIEASLQLEKMSRMYDVKNAYDAFQAAHTDALTNFDLVLKGFKRLGNEYGVHSRNP